MGDDQQGQRSRLRLPGVGGLPSVGSFGVTEFVTDRLTDAVSLLSALPDISATLQSINAHLINVDNEVTLMRQGVSRLEGDVNALRYEITQLRAEISSVNGHVEEMGDRLENMEPNIESIGRVAGVLRFSRRRHREVPAELESGSDETSDEELVPTASGFGALVGDDPNADLAHAARQLVEAAQAASLATHPAEATGEDTFEPPYGELD
jgi:septal ring factor EnvC (AmiA/AmiB activator)